MFLPGFELLLIPEIGEQLAISKKELSLSQDFRSTSLSIEVIYEGRQSLCFP
jgi:hypothetical protein